MPASLSSPPAHKAPARKPLTRRLAVAFAMGLAAGAAGYLFGRYVLTAAYPDGLPALAGLVWADGLIALSAVGLIMASLGIAVASRKAEPLGRLLKSEGPATPDEIANVRIQAAVSFMAGILLIAPPIATVAGFDAGWTYLALLVVLACQSLLNWRLFREGDEMIRDVMIRSGAVCFWGLQGLLFLYAAAERLGLVAPLTAWSMLAVLFAAYLVVSVVVATRRGLA